MFDSIMEGGPFLMPFVPPHLLKMITEVNEKRDRIEADFIQVFAQEGNFTISNETSTLQRHMYFFTTHYMLIDYTHLSTEFFQENYILMTTPAVSYTSYEKLMLPFDITTWMCLLFTFAIAFVVIFASRQTSEDKQNIIFGVKVQTPSLNVVGAFFGITQTRLPENNFARFILILFIFFCLIFRTAYQGKIYSLSVINKIYK